MMQQWETCKKEAGAALLLFRLGDFYEAFYEDATVLSKELDLTLTKRQDVPMAGIPCHTCETYLDRLVSKGYRIAIAEQVEDPKLTKGLVKRQVVRIVTPGTAVQSSLVSEKKNYFISCLTQQNSLFGHAVLDLSTGELSVMETDQKGAVQDDLNRLQPKEILLSSKWKEAHTDLWQGLDTTISTKEAFHFDPRITTEFLLKHFQVHTLDGFGLKEMTAALSAAGALLAYLNEDLLLPISHIDTIRKQTPSSFLSIDKTTFRHLEIEKLIEILDATQTPMGARLFRHCIAHPLLSVEEIEMRQNAVSEFLEKKPNLHLSHIRDLERLIMRIATGYASPRDLVGLRLSLESIPSLKEQLSPFLSPLLVFERSHLFDVEEIINLIRTAIVDTPPLRLSEGGIIRDGFNTDLDEWRHVQRESHGWVAQYQTELRNTTGVKTLKVGYTAAFGYYIEMSRGQSTKAPVDFQRRQTLVNSERFITPLLKEFEHKVLSAEEKISSLESMIFHQIREQIAAYLQPIRRLAQAVAKIDVLFSFANSARRFNHVQPQIDTSSLLHIEEGRHPIIETLCAQNLFIPNDTLMDGENNRLFLITGPNMAGKSTYIRQVALLVIMAQTGSFIPATHAHIGIIDKVFSRIGASDDLGNGQSTFMVEMAETANILRNATPRSLVILDEIGRGTSTYDGIAIAWAVAEYLLTHPGKQAKTLFATHYWELTRLETEIPGAVNYNVAVHESTNGIVFLRKIVRGDTDKSYGIHVAKLAGLPAAVIKRAQERLEQLEKTPERSRKTPQLNLF